MSRELTKGWQAGRRWWWSDSQQSESATEAPAHTAFSQNDPRWAGDLLGKSAVTIGQAGCLVTVTASVLADFGVKIDPRQLNDWLAENQGYVHGNLFVFSSVERLGIRLEDIVYCWWEPAPMEYVAEALGRGWGVAALVDFTPGGSIQQHWVRVLECTSDDCMIIDPWRPPGREVVSLLDYYGVPGWNAARAIMKLVFYSPAGGEMLRGRSEWQGEGQTSVCERREPGYGI
jgi:hypothetical protein